ncbi:hypothetical protein [Sphaerisporangium flaviroseum]
MKPRVEKVVDQESVRWIEQDGRLDAQFFKAAYLEALTEAHDDLARRQAQQLSQRSREVLIWLAIALPVVVSLLFAGVADSSIFTSLGIAALALILTRLGILLVEPSRGHHRSTKHEE